MAIKAVLQWRDGKLREGGKGADGGRQEKIGYNLRTIGDGGCTETSKCSSLAVNPFLHAYIRHAVLWLRWGSANDWDEWLFLGGTMMIAVPESAPPKIRFVFVVFNVKLVSD
jgi:hypothetical protein